MKILVTGAGGQLGRALPAALAPHEVVALGRAELDVTDATAVREAIARHRPDALVNAAAYNLVDQAESDPDAALALNTEAPGILARAAQAAGALIVHVSSDYVFDGELGRPYREDDAPNPLSAYGRSKLGGEETVRAGCPRHYLVRTAWVYAAEGRNFPLTMLELAKRGPLRVVDDQTGSPTYAPHLADAIAWLLGSGAPFGLYHLAGQGSTSWYGLTRALFERLGLAVPVSPVTTAEFPRPARRPRFSALETARQPAILLPPWQQGLDAFVAARAALGARPAG